MVGIVICNYNKMEYVLNCIRSVLSQTYKDYDLYVVDNASMDDSVAAIEREFSEDQVHLICNSENLGGSGGFNTGLRICLEKDYEYIMCVDNDIIMAEDNVERLVDFMETHKEVGMAGSKINLMDAPELLQSYGCVIDFERYNFFDYHKREREAESNIPEYEYCTFVPACSLIVRTEIVRKIGVMPEDNFIYWDDMEWGYLVNKAGWKVAVYREAAIRHKTGGVATNTFARYYLWRNRIRFFVKYLPEDKKEDFSRKILTELYRMMYGCYLKGDTNLSQSLYFALMDGIYNKAGMAGTGRILERNGKDRFSEALKMQAEGKYPKIVECNHVLEYKMPYNGEIIRDRYDNVITCEDDYYYCRSFDRMLDSFLTVTLPIMVDAIRSHNSDNL